VVGVPTNYNSIGKATNLKQILAHFPAHYMSYNYFNGMIYRIAFAIATHLYETNFYEPFEE
jgi:hypothetical protein